MVVASTSGSSGGVSTTSVASQQEALAAARRRAEEAARRAEQARQAAERARQAAERAAQQAQQAQQKLTQANQALQKAKGPEKQPAQERVDAARRELDQATRQRTTANAQLQQAEETVARTSKVAETDMQSANVIAAGANKPAAFTANQIARSGLRANEVRDAFQGSGARQTDLARVLGMAPSTQTNDIAATLKADREYAKLYQDPKSSQTLRTLNIYNGQDLRAFGQRLADRAQGGDPSSTDSGMSSIQDRASLAKVIRTAGNTLEGDAAATVSNEHFARSVSSGQDPLDAANTTPEDMAVAVFREQVEGAVTKPVDEWNHADANAFTEALAEQVEAHQDDPATVEAMLTLAGPRLQRSAELLGEATQTGGLSESDVEGMSENFSRIGNAAPPEAAAQLAYALAKEIPDGYEQEQVDDGFGKFIDNGGDSKFRDLLAGALAHQGKEDAAEELLKKGAGSLLSDPGGFIEDRFEDVAGAVGDVAEFFTGLAEKAVEEVYSFVSEEVVGRLGDAVRNAAADALNLDSQIDQLQSPGDSFSATANVEGSLLGVQVGAGVEMRITKTEDGYSMELSGEGSAGLAAKLNLPGLADAELEGEVTASATMKFEFDSVDQVTEAAETVAGVAVGAAATVAGGPLAPIGAAMIASAGDEIGDITDAYTGTTLQIEARASIGADLGEKLGLPGASANASAANAIAIEIPREGPPTLVLNQSLEVEGSLDITGPVTLPGGGNLAPGNVEGSANIGLETRVPIDVDLEELISDPVGALEDAGQNAIDNATTTLSGGFEFSSGIGVEGGGVNLSQNEGIAVDLHATANTRDIASALSKALSGDLGGALGSLAEDVTISGSVRAFTQSDAGIGSAAERTDGDANNEVDGEAVSVPGLGSLEVTAAVSTRSSRELAEFEGTPADFLRDFSSIIDGVAFEEAAA
ncbi:hypothetical protein [Pyxidicoccus xibeiensis]|uniref:hypothetical protein n=1 Tax=Pyxidicoccus xibeiensis TaxID=2906759 RepID=UPI0020A6F955|nr:hypothetical protein [Pyxidicoccus xibeiensis]MCP3144902.1 hypothetical protein [Pyxidicoccus xibeiensis]